MAVDDRGSSNRPHEEAATPNPDAAVSEGRDLGGLIEAGKGESDGDVPLRTGLVVSPDDSIDGNRAARPPGFVAPARVETIETADDADEGFDPEAFGAETDDMERNMSGRGRGAALLIALAALGGFVAVVWYAYNWGVGTIEQSALPVIAADQGPEKTRPEDPGGLEVPHQDKLVMNQGGASTEAPKVERLLPPPETPVEIERSEPIATEQPSAAEPRPSDLPAPPGMEETTEAARPDTALPSNPPEPPAVEERPATTAAAPEELQQTESSEAPAAPSRKPETEAAAASQQLAKATPPTATEPVGVGFTVQLASLKSREAAESAWSRIRDAQSPILGDRSANIVRVDLGARGVFYRLQAGPFESRAAAAEACDQLKTRQQDCLVVQR